MLFHVTANADWSNLPLSGLFVDMLRRLVELSVGVASAQGNAVLAPAETLDGFGLLSQPPPAAIGLAADKFASTPVSPQHPPGLYGPESGRQVLNLGTSIAAPEPAPPIAGATLETVRGSAPERALGPPILAFAILLLCVDMLISLALRGLLRAARLRHRRAAAVPGRPARPRPDSQPQPRDRHPARLHRLRRRPGRQHRQGRAGRAVRIRQRPHRRDAVRARRRAARPDRPQPVSPALLADHRRRPRPHRRRRPPRSTTT